MNPILLEILPFVKQGYCCSQLLVLLYLQSQGRENPELVKAMKGLCNGIGSSEGACGLLTGGACLINLLANGDNDKEILLMTNDYASWFYERTNKYGGCNCPQVYEALRQEQGHIGAGQEIDHSVCGDFFAECWEKILELCGEYEVEI